MQPLTTAETCPRIGTPMARLPTEEESATVEVLLSLLGRAVGGVVVAKNAIKIGW